MKKLTSQEIVERLTETFAKEGLRFTGIEVVGNAGDLQADEFTAGAPENTDGQNARLGGERSNQEPLEERGRSFGSAAVSGGSRVQVRIRLERFAPGLPTAFMVKGLQGTFRRYYDPDTDVILEEYKVLSQAEGAKPASSAVKEDFERAWKAHTGRAVFKAVPGIDLSGASAQLSACAWENFTAMLKRQDEKFAVVSLDNDPSRRVLRQWSSINSAYLHRFARSENLWALHLDVLTPDTPEAAVEHESKCLVPAEVDMLPARILVVKSASEA